MTVANDEAAMLLRLAGQDRLAFATLIANPQVELRIACFHAQQAVEKFLKAVLIAQGVTVAPTHNLLKLAALIPQEAAAVPVASEALQRLNPYAVAFRYDDRDIHLLTREDAQCTVDAIAAWAVGLLQLD